MIRLAHLSDTHLLAEPGDRLDGRDTAANLAAVLDAFDNRADVALVTGDIADVGALGAYRAAHPILDAAAPEVHVVPGNHDDTTNLGAVFGPVADVRAVTLSASWALVLVDSRAPSDGCGHLDDEALTALDTELASVSSRHALIALHHPPLSSCPYPYCVVDNASDVLAVLARHSNVRAVLSGHHHRAFDIKGADGTRYIGAPSTFRQLEHGGTPHFRETGAPPAATLLELHDDGAIVTHPVQSPTA
jgi:Icc protein